MDYEIACLNISPLGKETKSSLAAVGMWTDVSVRLVQVPSLQVVTTQPLGGEIIPRSVLLVTFEDVNYLLCGLGDGHLLSFLLKPTLELTDKRKVSLGTTPISLNTFSSGGSVNVFASSDRPSVIGSSNRKLIFANVNMKVKIYFVFFKTNPKLFFFFFFDI